MSVRRVGTRRMQAGLSEANPEERPRRSGTRRTPGAVPGSNETPPVPVHRSATKKAGFTPDANNTARSSSVPPRRKTTRRVPGANRGQDGSEQGIKELYPNNPSVFTDMDIVFVPGLGAHPEDSWRSRATEFNWISNKEGLARDFPRARILLYRYESSWIGNVKVKQYIGNLASTLLHSLQEARREHENARSRPIVFVGHSMGGLVIAKAICFAADSRQESFPRMFENVAGCIFFGTPFFGTPAAELGAVLAYLGEKFDQTVTTKLIELMKPDSEGLYELRNDFVRCVGKLSQRIKLFAFFEERETDLTKMVGNPMFSGLFKYIAPKSVQGVMVSRDSATLSGVMDSMGMATNHRDLVRFESFKDTRYQAVRDPMKAIIHSAYLVVKNRLNSTREIDREMVKTLMDMLDGAQVAKKRKNLSQSVVPSEWIPREAEYVNWLSKPGDASGTQPNPDRKGSDCLWIHGSEGRGKTSAALAALDDIEGMILNQEKKCSGEAPIILAYFFCDTTTDHCTAEDLLKSLVRQLIGRQEMLATYAKQFIKKVKDSDSKTQTSMTVENLWQALQDMLADEDIGSRVYLVLHNLHAFPDHLDSTKKFMSLLRDEFSTFRSDGNSTARRVPVRWLLTSRKSHLVRDALTPTTTPPTAESSPVRVIDLAASKYISQVQQTIHKHARSKVQGLAQRKGYSKALAYFATSLMARRAQNVQWIDTACVRLDELDTGSELAVRGVLESLPGDLSGLLDGTWTGLVGRCGRDEGERIREMLRVMALVFEDVTVEELGILAGLGGGGDTIEQDREGSGDLEGLVGKCKPFLELKGKGKVGFPNLVVKKHLLDNAERLLDLSEEKVRWQHGVIAHRAFTHIMDKCWVEEVAVNEEDENDGQTEQELTAEDSEWRQDQGSGSYYSDSNWDSEDEQPDGTPDEEMGQDADSPETDGGPLPSADQTWAEKPLAYAVKHWLHHASKATPEIAEELSLEFDFWEPESPIRHQWLKEYTDLTGDFLEDFGGFEHGTMSALHVASSLGFSQLVAALIKNGYGSEITVRDSTHSTPLHYAACFGRPHIVEVLLDNNAPVDDGSDFGELTPLHMAACKGNVEVMERLLKSKANPNAMCDVFGPVINGAIMSGNRKAVELLVDAKAELSLESNEFESPLALATLFPDKSMFDYLVKSCSDKLPDKEYEKALVKAAEEGRVDIFEQLLSASNVQYSRKAFEDALAAAERESSWDIIRILLTKQSGLNCVPLFTKAATGTASQDQILTDIWEYTQHNIPADDLNKCLYRATDLEKESTVELLLSFKADPNAMGKEYGNALTAAAFDGTINIVRMLIRVGADINSANGWPLHAAAAGGHLDVVAELLGQGAEINRVLAKGHRRMNHMIRAGTALQAACEAGKRDVVHLLLKHGADPNLGPQSAHNGGSSTCPLLVASRKGEKDIFEALIKAGAAVDVFGGAERTTPLINATACLPKECLELLLKSGANINLADKTGRDTALIVASRKGDADLVDYLLKNGADVLHSNRRGENALQAAALASREACLRVLIQHLSGIMAALKAAIDVGDEAVERIVRGIEEEKGGGEGEEKGGMVVGSADTDKEVVATCGDGSDEVSTVSTPALTTGTTIISESDDSSKIVVSVDQDIPEYMTDALADIDDLGFPFALPSLGLPSFTPASKPPTPNVPPKSPPPHPQPPQPPSAAPPPPPIRANEMPPVMASQDTVRLSQSNDSSRAPSPAIVRRKPAPNGVTTSRKSTVTFAGAVASDPSASGAPPTSSASRDQSPSTSLLAHRPSPEQDITGRPMSDSPKPLHDSFNLPPPAPPYSPPKTTPRQSQSLPGQKPEAARRDTAGSMSQPPAYVALVEANFRSQSQPQLLRQSQSSSQLHQLHQTNGSTSSSYSLRSLYSVPTSTPPPVSPITSPPPTSASIVSDASTNVAGLNIGIGILNTALQQQQELYRSFQQRQHQKVEAYTSFHERLKDTPPPPTPVFQPRSLQHTPATSPGWATQLGSSTSEQPVMHMNMLSSKPQAKPQEQVQPQPSPPPHPLKSHPVVTVQQIPSPSPPPQSKVTSPPISYDGEGWGDSPTTPEPQHAQLVDLKQLRHARTAILSSEQEPKGQGWTRSGSV